MRTKKNEIKNHLEKKSNLLNELSYREIKEVSGGVAWVPIILRGLAILASAAVMYHDETCCKCNPNNCK
ncbi:hypothetical protein EDL98_11105 [Ornithobacterium rhinotracheale]|nr:hypothetical protein [Ornithobacterium rhinotracheale]